MMTKSKPEGQSCKLYAKVDYRGQSHKYVNFKLRWQNCKLTKVLALYW